MLLHCSRCHDSKAEFESDGGSAFASDWVTHKAFSLFVES